MTPLDKLKQAAENSLKEKFSCVVFPYSGSGMLTNTEDSDVVEKNTNYCLTASIEFATSEAVREYWSIDAIEFAEWVGERFDYDCKIKKWCEENNCHTTEELYQEFLKQKQK